MPCYSPLQAYSLVLPSGKKQLKFSNFLAERWSKGLSMPEDSTGVPCRQCRGCRLENSRQRAIRCMHEVEMHTSCCFITLTFAPEHLPKDRSICKKHMQDFMHDLRQMCSRGFEYVDCKGKIQFYQKSEGIRYLYCGEYGEKFSRPHYHIILFGFDFPDKKFFKKTKGGRIYVSEILSRLWPFGHTGIGMVTFESAAYVSRYVMKKITGKMAVDHYDGLTPEFAEASRRPGLGRSYLEKFFSDIYPRDYVVIKNRRSPNGVKVRPPEYYDDYCKENYPDVWKVVEAARRERSEALPEGIYSFENLRKKEALIIQRMSSWTREIEQL